MSTRSLPHASRTTHYPTFAHTLLRPLGARWLGVLAVGFTCLLGLATSMVMPRGPVTSGQALLVMSSAMIAGLLAGFTLRSRWALVVAPLTYWLALEVGRLGAVVPTIDEVRLDSPYGIIALVLGRGLHGLLVLAPMLIGVGLGRLAAGAGRRRWPIIVAGTATIVLAIGVALPASTPPINGADGRPIPGSFTELSTVHLGGWISRS